MEDKAGLPQAVLDQLPLAIYSKSPGNIAFDYVNVAISSLTGLSVDEFLFLTNQQFCDRLHPDDEETYRHFIAVAWKDQTQQMQYRLRYRFCHQSGHYLWLEDQLRIVRDVNGKPVRLTGYLHEHEPALPLSSTSAIDQLSSSKAVNENFKQLLETLYEGVWQIDKHNNTVYVNTRLTEILGYMPDEMIGRSLFDFMDDKKRSLAHHYLKHRRQGQREQHDFEFLTKDGRYLLTRVSSSPLIDEAGQYLGAVAVVTDITEISEAQQRLQEREELMRNVTNNLPGLVMTYVLHPDGSDQILFISRGVQDIYQVSEEEATHDASTVWRRLHPDDIQKVQQSMLTSAEKLEPWYCEFRAFMPDGSVKWLCGRGTPRRMEDGSTLWHTLTLDETARKQAEQLLKESEERFHLVLKGSNDAYWDYDMITGEVFYSDRWWKMFGFESEEMNLDGTAWKERIHPDDRARVDRVINEALEKGKDSYEVESRRLHKDGHYIPVLGRGFIKRNANGQAIRISGTFFDMSRIKKAEQLLRESEFKFRSMVEGANAIIYTFNAKYEFNYISPAALHNTGYDSEELMKKSPFEMVHPDDLHTFRNVVETVRTTKQKRSGFEYRIFKKDGSISWRSGSITPLLDDQGEVNGFLGVAHDIEELKEKERKLAEAVVMKDKLFSIIGHDLKSPLNSILGLSEVMAENVHKGEIEEVKDLFDWIRKASQKSVDLLSNLLEWARSQTDEMQFNPTIQEVVPLIDATMEMVEETAAEKNIQLIKEVKPGIQVLCDVNMLKTVLRNLLSNAIKFTYEGGVVKLKVGQQAKWVKFAVQDNGMGISAESVQNLFSPNRPVKSMPGTKREKGTGLGLLLCKDFVEKQGGRIWAESEKEKGTSFFFTLPVSACNRVLTK